MEITGKIIVVLPPQSGVSQAGNNWKKQEYVLETEETYPKKVHFDFFGERADQYNWIKIDCCWIRYCVNECRTIN